jgi:hypothetical protein
VSEAGIQVVRQFHRCPLHDMPAYPTSARAGQLSVPPSWASAIPKTLAEQRFGFPPIGCEPCLSRREQRQLRTNRLPPTAAYRCSVARSRDPAERGPLRLREPNI